MTHPAPNSELTSESVKLLKAGDVLRPRDGWWPYQDCSPATFSHFTGNLIVLKERADESFFYDRFTFIGRPDADGWIPHDGGPNPFGDAKVTIDVRWIEGRDWNGRDDAASLNWNLVRAFRLAAPSVEREPKTASEIAFEAVTEGLTAPKPDVAGARERVNAFAKRWDARIGFGAQTSDLIYAITVHGFDGDAELRASDLREILSAYDRQAEEIERLRGALDEVSDFVDRDIIRVRPSERAEFLAGLERWNAARARQGGPDHG